MSMAIRSSSLSDARAPSGVPNRSEVGVAPNDGSVVSVAAGVGGITVEPVVSYELGRWCRLDHPELSYLRRKRHRNCRAGRDIVEHQLGLFRRSPPIEALGPALVEEVTAVGRLTEIRADPQPGREGRGGPIRSAP